MRSMRDMDLDRELVTALAGRYDIERELGRGGMAVVYLARDRKHSRDVALKVLRPELASAIGAERFQREVALSAPLVHPNILPVHDSGEAAGSLYFVMPYVEGSTLRQRIERETQLPIEDAIAIARQVAQALDHAHAHGVVHRDIKPDNILLQGNNVLVADFGLARAITTASNPALTGGMIVGTPAYMSPEQCTPGGPVDPRSDIYSLACVLFEMIAGEPPFHGATAEVLLGQHLVSDPPSLCHARRSCPPHLDEAVKRAMAKVPADRFRTAGAFIDAIQAPASAHIGQPARRSALMPRALVGLGVVAVVGVAAWLAAESRGRRAGVDGTRQPSVMLASAAPDMARHIAVLYFEDRSPDRRFAYLAAGLTETLIDRLSQVKGLHVISPNGVRSVRDSAMSLDVVARRLGVGTLIGGSLSGGRDTLRLTVRLIDGATGEQIQSHAIALPAAEFVRLQDSLATDVAMTLRERLGEQVTLREDRSGATSLPAWEAVQQGRAMLAQARGLPSDTARAIALIVRADSLFVRAEQMDRAWASPMVQRAQAALLIGYTRSPVLTADATHAVSASNFQRAVALADSALVVHPRDADALAARGEAMLRLAMLDPSPRGRSLRQQARASLEQAVAQRADMAHAWSMLGNLALDDDRFDDAYQAYRTAYDADAFLTEVRGVLNGLFFASLGVGRFTEAASWCATSRARFPNEPQFAECELTARGWSGRSRADVARAWAILRHVESSDSANALRFNAFGRRMMVAAILARAGMADSARAVIARAHSSFDGQSAAPVAEAYVRLLLGDRDDALRLLGAFAAAVPGARSRIGHMPWFTALRGDPAFDAIVRGGT